MKVNKMKNGIIVCIVLLVCIFIPACASVPKFDDVKNRDWKLAEVHVNSENITIERSEYTAAGFGEIFTLRFDDERISGVGAPNRYFAPYRLVDKQGIAINTIAGTLMIALFEPEKFKEHTFFVLLQNAYRWNLSGKNLELHSKGESGSEAVLIFAPR